jgi:hypothetical protein
LEASLKEHQSVLEIRRKNEIKPDLELTIKNALYSQKEYRALV